jgi:UbiD family decarboxylase
VKEEEEALGFDSMRAYLAAVEKEGLLQEINGADWNVEIGAITEVVAFSTAPRVLLFDSIQGYPPGFRVVTNLYSAQRLQAIALGLPDDVPTVELISRWRTRSKQLKPAKPRTVSDGPILQNVIRGSGVNLLKFPVPLWREHDGGRYLGTGDVVVTRDFDEKWFNLGVYRAQLHDEKTLGIVILNNHHGYMQLEKFWKRGEDAPIAIVAGQDPHVYAAACMSLPWGQSEYDIAGAFNGGPVDLIIHEPTGLPVPASAEIAIFGRVPPPTKQMRGEGPFGECLGYYTGQGPCPVVHVDEIWHRDDPILQGSPTMHGSAMMHGLGAEIFNSAVIWESVEREVTGVVGVCSLYQQCQAGSAVVVVAVRQAFPGHAKQAALAALASRGAALMNKAIIVVDHDVNPADPGEVMFAVTTRCSPSDDMDVIRGIPSTFLDPRVPADRRAAGDTTTSTVIINACRPFPGRDDYPRANIISPGLKSDILAKWGKELLLTR